MLRAGEIEVNDGDADRSRQRILVTGAGGLLGGRLASLLAARFDVVAAYRETAPPGGLCTIRFDILSPLAVLSALARTGASAVVHAAALADSGRCEREPRVADLVNVRAAAQVASACRERQVRLVALSTDLVFGGTRPFVSETDEPDPVLEYGRTKRRGELAVLESHEDACIARVALVCGRGHGARGTASESIAWAIREGSPLRLFEDEYRTPVDPESVADAIGRLVTSEERGIFHLGGPERLSRFDLGLRTARALGASAPSLVAAERSEAPGAARPADTSLDSSRAHEILGWRPRPLDSAVAESRRSPG